MIFKGIINTLIKISSLLSYNQKTEGKLVILSEENKAKLTLAVYKLGEVIQILSSIL